VKPLHIDFHFFDWYVSLPLPLWLGTSRGCRCSEYYLRTGIDR